MPDANPSPEIVDLLIIGGGPTGLFAAFYAGLRQMSVKIADSLDVLGGQLATLYPEKYIYDAPGFPKVLAKELVSRLVEQAMHARPSLRLGEQAARLDAADDGAGYSVATSGGIHRVRAVLVTAGVGAFQPKKLPLPNAVAYEGRGLYYFVRDIESLRGRRVLVVGGGDSAVDWVNALTGVAEHVTLIHRRDVFRAHEQSIDEMRAGPANVLLFHEL